MRAEDSVILLSTNPMVIDFLEEHDHKGHKSVLLLEEVSFQLSQ